MGRFRPVLRDKVRESLASVREWLLWLSDLLGCLLRGLLAFFPPPRGGGVWSNALKRRGRQAVHRGVHCVFQ